MGLTSFTSKQREITTDNSFEDQLRNLKSLIAQPPQTTRICEFGPELAEYILTNLNTLNRPRKARKIIDYRRDMQQNNWSLTGETIKFGTDGLLKDGQNRLAACVQAQTPFRTHAIFGIDPNTFHHMDTGKNRSSEDVLAIMGVPNAAKISHGIKWILTFQEGRTATKKGYSNQDIKDAYLNDLDNELLQRACSQARRVNRGTAIAYGQMMALYYLASEKGNESTVERFFEMLIVGNGTARAPVRYLLTTLNKLRTDRITPTPHQWTVMIGRTWHNFKNGKSSTKSDLHVTIDDRLMEI